MEGERILKSLLNGETDGLYEDTKNYLSPLQSPLKSKNGFKVGNKATEETVSKYTVFCTKFLRCAVETLKKVKAKGSNLDEVTNSLNLVGTLLNNTLSTHNGNYLKFIPSLDQLGKTIYLIVVQLIAKAQFDRALGHASDLLKFIQLLKTWKNYDSEKLDKELASLALRTSDVLLQGAGKLEEVKVTPVQRASHLCIVLDWRKLSLLFQAETIMHSSLKSLVDRALKCGTKYQVDCGQRSVNFKYLECFFESIFNVLLTKTELLSSNGKDSMLLLVELGFHYGRICNKAGSSTQALVVFDKLLEIARNASHSKNGQSKHQMPSQVCCCVCLVCKVALSINCATSAKTQTQDSCHQILCETNKLVSPVLKCKTLPSPMLKLLSDSLEYFRIILQNVCSKQTDNIKEKPPALTWRTFQGVVELLQSYVSVLSLQCEHVKAELHSVDSDDAVPQLRQQLQKITDRQLTVLSFVISSYQDQLKSEKDGLKNCNRNSRSDVIRNCVPAVQQASTLIHSALDDPDISLSLNELRWLGCNVYNLGCVSYQRDRFAEGVPLLTIACDELRIWCFAAESEEEILTRIEEVKLLTKFALLTDCQRRARQLSDALKTATTQILITLRTSSDADTIRQQVKQWTTVKHELVKSLQDEDKHSERSRTLCSALAEQEDTDDVDSSQLCLVLQEQLACYKVKSYDTAVEQISVIKQLMELYIVQEDEFHYGSVMLELAVALHSLRDSDLLEEDKCALEYCQEAAAVLEQLSDKVADTDDEENCHSSVVQDRVASAYLWQALLEHKAAMEEKQTVESPELSESFEADELEDICLEQEFVSSLHLALEAWTLLFGRLVQQGAYGKIDLRHFANAEETCHYLLITAGMFGLVNQPLKKVCALHLAGTAAQAIGTNSMLDTGVSAFSEAVHILCDMLDISHASLLLQRAGAMLDTFEPSDTAKVQFLLAKSHYLLVTGKYSEGEECLNKSLQSAVFTQKNYKSHLLKARLKSLCAKYSMLPATLHELTLKLDPVVGSLTALECAMDGFHKLSQMAEEVFGEDVFSSGKTKNKQKENVTAEGPLILLSTSQSLFHLSLLDGLLTSLLQVGQLYAHQGAVREAFRQFVDGLALARHFLLSYRIAEFLVNIAQLELKQGKTDKCQNRLDQMKGILQPFLNPSSKGKSPKEGIEEPLFIDHPESCECVSCVDTALHKILINYFVSLSKYLLSISRPEQSLPTLELTESVCECTERKLAKCLEKLEIVLCRAVGNDSSEDSLKETKKKSRARSAKGRKQKQETAVKKSSLQLLFSQHYGTLYCMNAELLLQTGKVGEANHVLSKAMEIVHCVENVLGNNPVNLLSIKASLLYLSGVTTLLLNKGSSSNVCGDCNWVCRHQIKEISGEDTVDVVTDSVKVDLADEAQIEKPRKGSSRRGRTSKAAEKTCIENDSKPKSSKARGRGRSKKTEESLTESNESDASLQQKPKGRKRPAKSARPPSKVADDNETAPKWLNQAILYLNEAFDLCQACPPPTLFANICQGLAFCHGRSEPQLSMYYLNLSSSVTLRHQAQTSTGKRIKRTTKEVSAAFSVEHDRDITCLAEELSSLSLNTTISTGITSGVKHKLEELFKTRNIMKFNSCPGRSVEPSSSPFSPEEIALMQNIPKEWTVCTLESFKLPGCEETELMICRIRAGCEPVLVKINTTAGEEDTKENNSDDIVMDLSKLFQCSLMEEFNDIMSDSVKSMSVDNTSEWWAQRTRLDTKMKDVLERLEASWLGRWKGVLLGHPVNKDHQESTASTAGQLQEKMLHLCGCEPDIQLLEVLVSSSSHLSRKETADAITEITGLDPSSPSLSQLVDEFKELTSSLFSRDSKMKDPSRTGSSSEIVSRHPVILILGKISEFMEIIQQQIADFTHTILRIPENETQQQQRLNLLDIQHLPWESIPMLYDHPVTRVPSLQFLLSKVSCQKQLTHVDPVKTFYALNPQNNLPNTQKMFQKWFESEDGWQGVTAKAPTQEEFSKALTDHEMFIYFGHGSGREFLQGDDIQRLDCRAVTLLMGCSSGKLMVGGECEPRGMVLNYLLAGCPAIVANLWDVTDKDIDRFSESVLKQWLHPDTHFSLPEVLSQSRQACKLKYLIGASPVLYGLPAYIKR